MKKISVFKVLALFTAATLLFAACTKETSDVRLDPKLATSQVLNIKSDSATVVGFIVAAGDGFSERGVCYDIAAAPTTDKSKAIYTGESSIATFNVKIGGLSYATTYYARAYAINASGTIYGEEVSFTTLPVVPTINTEVISSITGNSAAGGGNVTISGGADVTARGICYGITHNPTVTGSKTADGTGTGAFTSSLTSLSGNTLYYVRAYATNSAGTGYGTEVSFSTLVDLPVVTTADVTEITKVSAVSGGEVTYDGGALITERGIVWGTAADPTTGNNKITGGTGTGEFVSNLTGLSVFTSYHVRAYAINSAGTAYGSDKSFTTLADITKFWVVGSYNGWSNSDAALYIISTATSSEAQGYVYFPAAGEFKLTTDHSWDDAHTFGDDGSGGLTNPGGNIVVSAAGYQFIKANLADNSYSVTLTNWGVIGSASPNGWDDETALTYNTDLSAWIGGIHLTAAEFKFRANHSWDYNYGSTTGDGTLDPGGSNISVDTEADYAFTLDLSHPNAYTYTANRWGIIGSATANGWDSDQNMTWDAVNKVFTATLNLTANEMKFRANDGWDINLGGDLNTLTPGGANIAIATAGNYTITLDPWAKTAIVTLN